MGVEINLTGQGTQDPGTRVVSQQNEPVTYTSPISTEATDAVKQQDGPLTTESLAHTEKPTGLAEQASEPMTIEDPAFAAIREARKVQKNEEKARKSAEDKAVKSVEDKSTSPQKTKSPRRKRAT